MSFQSSRLARYTIIKGFRTGFKRSLLRNFGSSLGAIGGAAGAALATRGPTPFAFPFTPLGLNLFDIDPSRILTMLHHQTWLAEEALRNRGLLQAAPKEFPHRFNPLGDFLAKEYHASHLHPSTADFLQCATSSASSSSAAETPITSKQQRSHATQQQQQQQQQYKQQPQPYNIRYPSPAGGFFHPQHQHHHSHHHHQQPQHHSPHLLKAAKRQSTPSPHQTATSTQSSVLLDELRRKTESGPTPDDDSSVIDISSGREESHTPRELGSIMPVATSSLLYKDSPLDQLLHRRRSSSSLGGAAGGVDSSTLRSYSQLLLSTTPSCTDTSSCKEKSSSSSTSSTPPPTSALLAQHQQLSQMLQSPSDSSLFGGDGIEEETRCVVCNAHFPNVWLLEQHAALQHPLLGPGEEKPFICEQCGQSYRYRSAYAKHKEQNHRARLPADKLFTCDVCGMQFRYLKSFKKHRLNHALERLHGKKGVGGKHLPPAAAAHLEQDVVTSSQEAAMPDEGEDLRVKVKREKAHAADDDGCGGGQEPLEDDQDSTIDSASVMLFNDTNSSASAATSGIEQNISSTDAIHSTNKRPRLLTTPVIESDPSYRHQHHRLHHGHLASQYPHVGGHLHASTSAASSGQRPHGGHSQSPVSGSQLSASPPAPSMASLTSLNSITSLINAERIPNEQQFLGLNPQEASILNFLRVDAAERQRDKRPQTSRFACPFCGKCVRSKENLKLHVRKHTGERPFVCLFCGRAFGGKSDLTRHLRIHTGERPYHCESCGKCFARADYLSKHLTTHIHNAPR